jgi:membrane-associated phospholipid phosphatase
MLLATEFALCGALLALNTHYFHYTTSVYNVNPTHTVSHSHLLLSALLASLFWSYGLYIREQSPRSSTFLWGIGLFFWTVVINIVGSGAIALTPFPPIDTLLAAIDAHIGIHTPALMAWTHHHPHFYTVFHFTYNSMAFELLLIPLALLLSNARKAVGVFFIAELITVFIGFALYYFFPTMAPSGIFHSPYFSPAQHDTSLRFYEMHHFLKITSTAGGLIAFPSFHVIWAILLTYAVRAQKIIFYPLCCYNFVLIMATVFLGWHYAMDVVGGIMVAMIAIGLANWVYRNANT